MSLKQPKDTGELMPTAKRSSRTAIAMFAGVAITVAALGGYLASGASLFAYAQGGGSAVKADAANPAVAKSDTATRWVAAAPGRVEPKDGLVRIGAPQIGRIGELLVAVNDRVEAGEMLVRLDDAEYRAKLAAAETEAGSRMRERDAAGLSSSRADVRKAEDEVFDAERTVTGARIELDTMLKSRRKGEANDQNVDDARRRLADAEKRLKTERTNLAKAEAKANIGEPSRIESGLSAARSDVAIADALLDKTRIRASKAGTVLEVNVKDGEIVAPSPELPLIIIGDLSSLRVKTEVSETDTAKVKVGQKAFVKTAAFPGQEFAAKVSAIAPSLAAPKLSGRGPRRATDVDVLEVTLDLEGQTALRPGMRVDAFFLTE